MQGANYLKCLARYGLDTRILQDYKAYDLIYYSKRNVNGTADIGKFVDYEGVDRYLIHKVRELENLYNVEVFHIIWNSSKEMVLMYHSNDEHMDLKGQLDMFKEGSCFALKYYIQENKVKFYNVRYDVVYGAIVDVDFKLNM